MTKFVIAGHTQETTTELYLRPAISSKGGITLAARNHAFDTGVVVFYPSVRLKSTGLLVMDRLQIPLAAQVALGIYAPEGKEIAIQDTRSYLFDR